MRRLGPLTIASLLALLAPSRLDNLISSHLNNSERKDSAASMFGLQCDYHSIESNYFEQVNNTFALSPGSVIRYKCTLQIDATNCSAYHGTSAQVPPAAVTKLIPLNCQDVQIVIQQPPSVTDSAELSRLVGESAVQVPSQSSLDQYTAWLNVSNFTEAHQGQYSFLFQTSPPLRTLFHHRFTLLSANATTSPEHVSVNWQVGQEERPSSSGQSSSCAQIDDEWHCQAWLVLGLFSFAVGLICVAIYLFAFRRIHRPQRIACLPGEEL